MSPRKGEIAKNWKTFRKDKRQKRKTPNLSCIC